MSRCGQTSTTNHKWSHQGRIQARSRVNSCIHSWKSEHARRGDSSRRFESSGGSAATRRVGVPRVQRPRGNPDVLSNAGGTHARSTEREMGCLRFHPHRRERVRSVRCGSPKQVLAINAVRFRPYEGTRCAPSLLHNRTHSVISQRMRTPLMM